jgi:protein-S-isoprenylcysteine O-methyltransferase Ste14
MGSLENRIPPPIVVLLTAALMLALDQIAPGLRIGMDVHMAQSLGGSIAFCGFAIDVHCLINFIACKTSASPLKPEKATSIISTGFYRVSRNPMYLGMVVVLLGWAVMLLNPLSLIGLPLFVAFIQRFQIAPEERALTQRFGDEYLDYTRKVRRWI